MKVATSVDTKLWSQIVDSLQNEGWFCQRKYDAHDAGVDFDYIELTKGDEIIIFGWDSCSEGEIKATERRLQRLAQQHQIDFQYGKPKHLSSAEILFSKSMIKKRKPSSLIDRIRTYFVRP